MDCIGVKDCFGVRGVVGLKEVGLDKGPELVDGVVLLSGTTTSVCCIGSRATLQSSIALLNKISSRPA